MKFVVDANIHPFRTHLRLDDALPPVVEPENDLGATPAYVHGKLEKCQEMVSEKSSLTLTEVEDLIKIPPSGPTWSLGQGSSTRFPRGHTDHVGHRSR